MVFITTKIWQDNSVGVIPVDNIKWLNGKHIETELGHSNLAAITLKYPKDLRKEDNNYKIVIISPVESS